MRPSRPGWLPELPEYLLPVSLIADGVYGKVIRAEDTRRGRAVAVRILEEKSGGPSKASRLEAAERLSTIDHPNVAAIYEVATFGSSSYIELELVEGSSLASRLAQRPALPYPEVVAIGRQLASALHVAHSVGVVHGDLNPANVLFTDAGEPKVIDFRFLIGERSGFVAGNVGAAPKYLSPEFVLDAPLDATSDVYSLGAILHQALSGRLPFDSIYSDVDPVAGSRPSIRALPEAPVGMPKVPPELGDVVMRCVAKRSEARFPSAEALFHALEGLDRAEAPPPPALTSREATTLTGVHPARDSRVERKVVPASFGRRMAVATLSILGLASAGAGAWQFLHPETLAMFRARASAPAPSREVVIDVTSDPPGGLVYFRGGAVLGTAPAQVRVARGTGARELVVRFADGEERTVSVHPSRPITLLVQASNEEAPEPTAQ